MEITGESLDDLLRAAFETIRSTGKPNKGSRGATREILGVVLRLTNPRARLSRSEDRGVPFSALGELLWYLSGDGDPAFIASHIPAYIKEIGPDGAINGAYGPRLASRFGLNQIDAIIKLLEAKPTSRRAVAQIYAATDLEFTGEVPCTTTLQFFNRDDALHLAVNLRSNDAYLGLPHDVFCFTMLQEMMARRLKLGLGEYIHTVGSFHIYDKHDPRVDQYLREGYQRLAPMPDMPEDDPFPLIPELLAYEKAIRDGSHKTASFDKLPGYWADLMRLILVNFNSDNPSLMDDVSASLVTTSYQILLDERRGRKPMTQVDIAAALDRRADT